MNFWIGLWEGPVLGLSKVYPKIQNKLIEVWVEEFPLKLFRLLEWVSLILHADF